MASKSGVSDTLSPSDKRTLSSRVSSMKFMQRKNEADLRDRLAADQNQAVKKSQWLPVPGRFW
jgi:hypothetical protein